MTENPVDYIIRCTGLSRSEFTAKHGFGKNLLGRVSQGRLQSVTPRIANALWAEWEEKGQPQGSFYGKYGTLDIDEAYQNWVHNRRVSNRAKLPRTIPESTTLSPFARFVKAVGSVSATAKLLAVADVSVQRYADGRVKAMPEAIRTALHEMQYPHTDSLDKQQQRWHAKQESR